MHKATFPHLGNFYIPGRALLMELGLEPVIPPLTSQQTINLGTKIAPEFACFPFKVNLGNYIEAIEAGAELIIMVGGIGPCRFGYYGTLQGEILQEAGYEVDCLILEAPKTHFQELIWKIRRYIPRHQVNDLFRALRIFWVKAHLLDEFDRNVNKVRPLEEVPGSSTKIQQMFYKKLDHTSSINEAKQLYQNSLAELHSLSQKEMNPPKISFLGEIYMVLEPQVNFQLEKKLGSMGVEVERTIYLSDWVQEHLGLGILNPRWLRELKELAKPYLRNPVGGHGLESVAHTVKAGINLFDGIIHLAPFTCMPEIIASQMFPTITKELAIPVLSIIVDEHSAQAGVETRLEAFIDLIRYKKRCSEYQPLLEEPLPASPQDNPSYA